MTQMISVYETTGKKSTRQSHGKETVRSAATGRWREIITSICPSITPDHLDGRQQPCPLCGGTDRFRVFENFGETGGAFCNRCHAKNNGDGFATVGWLLGIPFGEAVDRVGEYLGVAATPRSSSSVSQSPSNGRHHSAADDRSISHSDTVTIGRRGDRSDELTWRRETADMNRWGQPFSAAKPGITLGGLRAVGKIAVLNGRHGVVGFAYRDSAGDVCGAHVYPLGSGKKARKICGSRDGITRWAKPGEPASTAPIAIVTEGHTDMAAVVSSIIADERYPAGTIVMTAGSASTAPQTWAVPAGSRVYLLFDCDAAGQDGSLAWMTVLQSAGHDVVHVALPYPIADTGGRDVRDYIADGGDLYDLLRSARRAGSRPVIATESPSRVAATSSALPAGTRVRAGDRGNIGTIVADHGETVTVEFVSRDGNRAETNLPRSIVRPLATAGPREFAFVDAATLDATHYPITYLIDGILVEHQPAIIGGLPKTLKTSIALDAAVSMASGTPFLGRFSSHRRTVAVMSGESGLPVIQRTLRRICRARNVSLSLCDLHVCDALPRVSDVDDMQNLADVVRSLTAHVLIIDPIYLALMAGGAETNAANVLAMGPLLAELTELGRSTDTTIIVLHHFRKNSLSGERFGKPELEDLSMAGFAEWARQWMLISRRQRYEPGTGDHRLWLTAGGSAGHGGEYAIDVSEGVGLDDRTWDVAITPASEAADLQREASAAAKAEKRSADIRDAQEKIIKALVSGTDGAGTRSAVAERSGMGPSSKIFRESLAMLLREGRVTECDVRSANGQTYAGYRLIGKKIKK